MPASRLPNDWSRVNDPTVALQEVLDDHADLIDGASGGSVTVRKNSGADVGTRPRINLIEGANVTLTITDDTGDNEVDVTIAASGGGGSGNEGYSFFLAG